jgi:hypothetical protein
MWTCVLACPASSTAAGSAVTRHSGQEATADRVRVCEDSPRAL